MANLNKVLLMGRLTRDPELRYTPKGTAVTDVGLATNRIRVDPGSGERTEETTFVDVTVWGRQAETICKYLGKGQPIFIEGRLSLDTWEQDGQKRSRMKVICENFQFLNTRSDRPGGGYGRGPQGEGGEETARPSSYPATRERGAVPAAAEPDEGLDSLDDSEIPF